MSTQITSGNATVFVSDMDAALHFYTTVLGGDMSFRAGDDWAEVSYGSFTVGLHGPPRPESPCQPGVPGAVCVGLACDGPLEDIATSLAQHGVAFIGPISDNPNEPIRIARLQDPDGNELYICEHKPLPS